MKNQKISTSLKKYHHKKRTRIQRRKELKVIFWILLAIGLIGFYTQHRVISPVEAQAPYGKIWQTFPIAEDKDKTPLVIFQTKTTDKSEKEYIEMWRVINIESAWKPNAKNAHSTAKGLGQFINKTWEHYCPGEVLNAEDNLDCFVKLYPKHKSWWEGARLLGYTN
jgi:hypothetical protein